MRPIKFRALKDDISNCTFVYGQLVYRTDEMTGKQYPAITTDGGLTFHSCLRGTEGQFIRTDKNGREIYEHDKVKDSNGEVWIVAYYENAFCLVTKLMPEVEMMDEVMLMHMIDWTELEVIGNIHEGGSNES